MRRLIWLVLVFGVVGCEQVNEPSIDIDAMHLEPDAELKITIEYRPGTTGAKQPIQAEINGETVTIPGVE